MQCTFQVGDKVTLIEEIENDFVYGEALPAIDQVYTVRDVWVHPLDVVTIRLVEIVNPPLRYRHGTFECAWIAADFRRVLKNDISDLQKIARDVFEGERELLPMGVIR